MAYPLRATPVRALALAITWLLPSTLDACPFCGIVGQSLAERRDGAAVVAVGEAEGDASPDEAGLPAQHFRIHQLLRGEPDDPPTAGETIGSRVAGPLTGTVVLFGNTSGAALNAPLRWEAVAANEAVLGHVAAAPAVGDPPAERLRWFAGRLEHPDPTIAADAFTEFGLAPFAAVRAAAAGLDPQKLRLWVAEPGVDERRRGFYGLALGLTAAHAGSAAERDASIDVLHRAIAAPADDFRAGIDGLMGGLLVAEGERGLDYLKRCGLFGPAGRPVDKRHLLSALRFAWENLGDSIPHDRIAAATAKLLTSPVVAADAAIDLARYQAWTAVGEVANLWDTLGTDDPLIRRAVAGYLSACPQPSAKEHLARIRRQNPELLHRAIEAAGLPK